MVVDELPPPLRREPAHDADVCDRPMKISRSAQSCVTMTFQRAIGWASSSSIVPRLSSPLTTSLPRAMARAAATASAPFFASSSSLLPRSRPRFLLSWLRLLCSASTSARSERRLASSSIIWSMRPRALSSCRLRICALTHSGSSRMRSMSIMLAVSPLLFLRRFVRCFPCVVMRVRWLCIVQRA